MDARQALWMSSSARTMALIVGSIFFDLSGIAKPQPPVLPVPPAEHAFETLKSEIRDIYSFNKKIYLIPMAGSVVIESPFNPAGKSAAETFGSLSDGRKIPIKAAANSSPWDSIEVDNDGIKILSGRLPSIVHTQDDGTLNSTIDVIYDRVKPPADSRGEPPQFEISKVRAKFLKVFASPDKRLLGMRRVPLSWRGLPKNSYLAVAQQREFPLLLLKCHDGGEGGCVVDRVCASEGFQNIALEDISGFALHPDRRLILLADTSAQMIHFIEFAGCNLSQYHGAVALPARLKPVSSVFVDDATNLLISTKTRDDYFNASVFFWPKKEWEGLLK
jgi:hypothetical protein